MLRRIAMIAVLAAVGMSLTACHNNKVKNPLAQVDSKQPEKVLFDRALTAMHQRKYDVARLSLQTLINTYPESEFVARAKLGIGDSWYAEGGTAALAQAENEYKDFIIFYPQMTKECSEAQSKIADIHYRAMEKADRDFTHAKRAEEEYRTMLLNYPDTDKKLLDMSRKRLLEVQEVLAEREYRIGRFYFVRQSYNAAIARLQSMVDAYPLYSRADDALFMVGQSYEAEANMIRNVTRLKEQTKAKLIKDAEDKAAEAYARIVTRYPAMDRANEARNRLKALDKVVPKPTEEAIAQNKKEEASRGQVGRIGGVMDRFRKRPNVSIASAATYGEPTLVDPKPTDAATLTRRTAEQITGISQGGEGVVNAEQMKDGKIPEAGEVPRSKDDPDKPAAPPAQLNEAANSSSSVDTQDKSAPVDNSASTSKPKKKKGLRRLIPF